MATSPETESHSLKTLFANAEERKLSIASLQYNTPEWTAAYTEALQGFTDCLRLSRDMALFSSNETIDDLATADLPFLSIQYHLAEITLKTAFTTPEARVGVVRKARDEFEAFLTQMDHYDLLGVQYAEQYLRFLDDRDKFSAIDARDPAARRDAKMASFAAEKQIRQRLATLRANPRYVENGGDEDLVRETYLANLELQIHDALQQIDSVNRELDILAQAPPRPPQPQSSGPLMADGGDPRSRRTASGKPETDYSERLDAPLSRNPGGPLLSKAGKPLQPFTLVGNRQDLKKGVFRPGHNLPTMSIDEYLEEEKRRGNIIEGGGAASMVKPEPDEDNEEKADAETMKARKWDDYKDDNPRGAGNTVNRG
ncbi:putative protein C63.05 [Ceratocystis platani]|uniref:Type 2A phosphatase-associated protein 42 n=1 Tax=Ceratocystis fimbriata f. sp. platani TaxID=88771 RepID=A0A0F8DJX6_CERFI|nr:putative protein C63.05 [Ceratocystis platani]